jgi:ATP-dependent DNA helicase RecQ
MHKAKGKEFDNVFLLLDNFKTYEEEKIRVLYVALTRAKQNLVIHTGTDIFSEILVSHCNRFFDDDAYSAPARLSLQLTPRDVYLNYFTEDKIIKTIKSLSAGDPLTAAKYDPTILTYKNSKTLKYSSNGAERIEKLLKRGYRIESIQAEYIIIWKRKEEKEQYRVVLPLIEFRKKKSSAF